MHTSAETAARAPLPRCTISTTSVEIYAGSQSRPLLVLPWCSGCGRPSRSSPKLVSRQHPVPAAAGTRSGGAGKWAFKARAGKELVPACSGDWEVMRIAPRGSRVKPGLGGLALSWQDYDCAGGSTRANVKRPSAAVSPSTVALALARPMPRRRRSISTSSRS